MTITAKCSCCGREEDYELSAKEEYFLRGYQMFGREFGMTLQEMFPDIPAWIRSGAIDQTANGFCICPECSRWEM